MENGISNKNKLGKLNYFEITEGNGSLFSEDLTKKQNLLSNSIYPVTHIITDKNNS